MLYCGRKEEAEEIPSGVFSGECYVRGYQLWKSLSYPQPGDHSLGTGPCGISLCSDPPPVPHLVPQAHITVMIQWIKGCLLVPRGRPSEQDLVVS